MLNRSLDALVVRAWLYLRHLPQYSLSFLHLSVCSERIGAEEINRFASQLVSASNDFIHLHLQWHSGTLALKNVLSTALPSYD